MFALCSAMLASAASAAVYKVDEFHTNARFAIDHFNTSTNVGGIYGLTGNLEFDRAKTPRLYRYRIAFVQTANRF